MSSTTGGGGGRRRGHRGRGGQMGGRGGRRRGPAMPFTNARGALLEVLEDGPLDSESNLYRLFNQLTPTIPRRVWSSDDGKRLEGEKDATVGGAPVAKEAGATGAPPARPSYLQQERNYNYFFLADLWKFYDQPFGHRVDWKAEDGSESAVFFVPHLSALQMFSLGSVASEPAGRILAQHFETKTPDLRIPLADLVKDLAKRFPALMTSRSDALHPLSWYAVQWVPIPCHTNTMDDLSGSFFTYHWMNNFTLSLFPTPHYFIPHFSEEDALITASGIRRIIGAHPSKEETLRSSSWLRPLLFAFVPYKVKNSLWFRKIADRSPGRYSAPLQMIVAVQRHLGTMRVRHPDFDHCLTFSPPLFALLYGGAMM